MVPDINTSKSLREILTDFFDMSNAAVRDVEKHAKLVKLKKNEAVVRQGEVCDYIVFNKCGLLRVTHTTEDSEDTLLFGSAGDVFTSLHSFQCGLPSIFSLVSVLESEVWLLSYADWRELEKRHPELIKWMRDLLLLQIYGFENRYLWYHGCSAEERFHRFLCMDRKDLPIPSVKLLTTLIPIKYLASYLNISRWTLSRLRNKLVRGGSSSINTSDSKKR